MIKYCTGIFLATSATMLLFWMTVPGGWSEEGASDYQSSYAPTARHFLAGHGWINAKGKPAVRYPPGFPLLLAGLFQMTRWTGTSERLWLQMFTLLAMGLTCVLFYGLARMVVSGKAALIAAGLWMTYPFHLWLTKQPNSEIPFFPLLYGALFLFGGMLWRGWQRPWIPLMVGALVGSAALVRPIALLVGVILMALMVSLRWRDGGKRWGVLAVCLLVGNIIVIMPWEVWVWQETGKWIPLSTGGAVSIRDGLTCFIHTKGFRRPLKVPPAMREVIEEALQYWQEGTLETTGQIARFLEQQIRKNPKGVLQLFWWKMKRAWYGTDAQRPEERWILLIQMGYLLPALGGSVLLWRRGRWQREWISLVVLMLVYFWAMTVMVLSILRYMVPVMGLLFPSIGILLEQVAGKIIHEGSDGEAVFLT